MSKLFNAEFASGRHFSTLELDDYVYWFNNIRIHGMIGHLSPVEFEQQIL
ncbi:IS3 family transposase [Lysinibacillus sp. FSL L8-0312]